MKKKIILWIFITFLVFGTCWATKPEIPSFLPEYYSALFELDGHQLVLVKHSTANNVDQWVYNRGDLSLSLLIENIKSDRPSSRGILNNILGYLNKEMEGKKGEFVKITEEEIHARILEAGIERTLFVSAVPGAIQIWTYSTKPGTARQLDEYLKTIRTLANRQRYTDAKAEGNVSMGFWGPQIYEYASHLLQKGDRKAALSVYEDHLRTSPFNYEAHIDFLENSNDSKVAANSAKIVLKNAENLILIEKAAKFLKTNLKSFNSIPFLEKRERGLQLILIPIGRCNIWLLEESAKTYENITKIPTKIRRIKEEWPLGAPDRIPYQRRVQEILVKLKKKNIDFNNWTKARYIEELMSSVETEDALSKYYVKDLIEKINEGNGQFLVDPHLDWFLKTLEKYRSEDQRTMYVGITEVNIYSGDNNYVFSFGTTGVSSGASILSYHMMLAETLSEEYQSRQRLTERIAKELVPASIKQLGIPRSTDPSCPYSYSGGVSRLDQKTLILSDGVKEALHKIRLQP
ncbi:hypothetical protein [Desulfospira joergensenii]|uniref:hypothetical protein n=1 Tax=Desulfospira joergensenii TaxID=53329 RepID=UPI0003B5824C|nr:hypothetical protein [Desulfospira joergensenii]